MATTPAKIDWQSLPAAKSGQFRIGGDLIVNRLGFGSMRLTGKGIWGPPKDHNEAIRVLRRAVELGINFIDTADSYGPHVAEELIAEALHPYPAGLVIATKAGFERPGPDKWVTNGRPEHLRAACEGSLKRLRLDRIELFQLHRIDSKVPADDQLGALQLLQSEGKINHIGLSEVSVKEIEHARSIVPIVSVQNRYSVVDRAAEEVVDYCDRTQIGFIDDPEDPADDRLLECPRQILALRRDLAAHAEERHEGLDRAFVALDRGRAGGERLDDAGAGQRRLGRHVMEEGGEAGS